MALRGFFLLRRDRYELEPVRVSAATPVPVGLSLSSTDQADKRAGAFVCDKFQGIVDKPDDPEDHEVNRLSQFRSSLRADASTIGNPAV